MHFSSRTKAGGVLAAGALFLALASVASACTVFKGKLTVSGNGLGSTTQTVSGNNLGMTWCPSPTSFTVKVDGSAAAVTLSTAEADLGSCVGLHNPVGNRMADGTYTVAVNPGFMPAGGGSGSVHNCHGSSTNTSIGTFVVSGGAGVGSGSYTYTMSNTPSPGWHSICIYQPTGNADAAAINIQAL